jgi:thiol-disulfide isomerase/thioredoxin
LVFVVAGVAKLADRKGSRQAIADFGVPSALATPLGSLLPLAELAVAAALIPTSTAWWGAVGALTLLLLFVVGIGINLARGRKPDCHCFGQLHSSPAGWSTLVRNGVLAAVAAFIVWQGGDGAGPSAVNWLWALSVVQLLALIGGLLLLGLLAVVGWFLVHLLRQNGRLLVRIEALEERLASGEGAAPAQDEAHQAPGLPVGAEAPTFRLQGLYGETLTLEALRAPGKPVMLLFTDPNCGPCTAMLPEIGRWQQEHAEKLTISLISRGVLEDNRTKSTEHGLTNVLLQENWEVSEAYQVAGTPSAVIVEPDGKVGSSVAGGSIAIESLVAQTVGAPRPELPVQPQQAQGDPCPNCGQVHADNGQAASAGPKIGEPAPELKLPDLSGKTIELKNYRDKKTLVLFWNPGCGFCQQMIPDLKEWETNPPEGAPELLIVSSGTEEANREMGLRSPVVLDQRFGTGSAFGASGTPSAVLVDEEGKVASEVAVGAPAVLALAGGGDGGVAAQQAAPAAPRIGEPAPALKLPNLRGKRVNLAAFRGHKTLVLFWNPGCGFCQQMLPDLKEWEQNPPEGAPKLLVVSAGTAEDNREMGLSSTVVLDQNFAAGSAFGAGGTPSAVLVDENGNIASELAVGGPAVLELARARRAT